MIYDLDLFFFGPVERGQIRKHFKIKSLIVAQKTADLDNRLRIDNQIRLRDIALELTDFVGKLLFKPLINRGGFHSYALTPFSAGRAGLTSQRSRIILS